MIGKQITRGADPRWVWLSTVAAIVVLISLPTIVVLTVLGMATVATLTQAWFMLYATLCLSAMAYAFGRETLEVVYHFRNGGFPTADDDEEN